MAVVNKDGIIANKMTLAQYRTLKANNQLVNNEIYTFTDIDVEIDNIVINLESMDRNNPIVLRGLADGLYKIRGYMKYYEGFSGIIAADPSVLVQIGNSSTKTYVLFVDYSGFQKYEITNTSYECTSDSGWVNATLVSGFKNYGGSSSNAPQYRKVGDVVEVRGVLSPTTAVTASSNGVTMFTLPTGFRPSKPTYAICQGSGKNTWLLSVTTAGAVQISRYGVSGNTDIPTTAWLVLNITFTV